MKWIFWTTEFLPNEEHVIPRFQRPRHILSKMCECNPEISKVPIKGTIGIVMYEVIVHRRLK